MSHWRMVVVLLSALLVPTVALAASAGKVVIAQGVDPTSLDMMNQQEQPASNVGAQMFESLLERDQSLKLGPDAGRRDAQVGEPRPPGSSSCARASSSTTARSSTPSR